MRLYTHLCVFFRAAAASDDVFVFDTTLGQWEYISGSNQPQAPAHYGSIGVPVCLSFSASVSCMFLVCHYCVFRRLVTRLVVVRSRFLWLTATVKFGHSVESNRYDACVVLFAVCVLSCLSCFI